MKTPPKSWSKLTMYDRIQHSMPREFNAANFRSARRFAITDRACERTREAMASTPEYIGENSEFAIPAFDVMWVEFNARVMLKHRLLSGDSIDRDPSSDLNVGYLFNGKEVQVFSERDDLEPFALPIRYKLNTRMSHADEIRISEWFGVSRIGLDPFFWGHEMHRSLSSEHRSLLRSQHAIEFDDVLLNSPENMRYGVYTGSAGELRNMIAVLLMINQSSKIIQTREIPRKRGLVKGKPMTYFGHSLIDIDIDRRRKINVLAKPKRGQANWQLRWHEVRGHFVHTNVRNTDHSHEWEEVSPRKWRCQVEGCRATRTWREYPEGKGTAEKGFVRQKRLIRTKHDDASEYEMAL